MFYNISYHLSTVYKMMACVRHSTESCDPMMADMRLNATIHHKISMVMEMCDRNLMMRIMSREVLTEEQNMDFVEDLAEAVGGKIFC